MSVDNPGQDTHERSYDVGGDAMTAQAQVLEAAFVADADVESWFDQIVVPDGCRVELIEGEIVVSPSPTNHHEVDVAELLAQLVPRVSPDFLLAPTMGARSPRGRYIPDLFVVRRDVLRGRDEQTWSDAGEAAMVVEVTSSRPSTDREVKRLGYAEAAVPLYLLVDRERREVALFADPADGDYRAAAKVPFGTPLDLPDPFGFTLDTSTLV